MTNTIISKSGIAELKQYLTKIGLDDDADTYRFDGSDLMPTDVGSGTFFQGIVDWVEGKGLDSVLRGIDNSRPRKKRL